MLEIHVGALKGNSMLNGKLDCSHDMCWNKNTYGFMIRLSLLFPARVPYQKTNNKACDRCLP